MSSIYQERVRQKMERIIPSNPQQIYYFRVLIHQQLSLSSNSSVICWKNPLLLRYFQSIDSLQNTKLITMRNSLSAKRHILCSLTLMLNKYRRRNLKYFSVDEPIWLSDQSIIHFRKHSWCLMKASINKREQFYWSYRKASNDGF